MFPMPDLGDGLFHQPNTTSETMHSDSDLQSDIFTPATTIVAEKTSKFHPKPCINNKKNLPMPSKSRASEGPSSTSKFHDPAYNRWPVEGSSGPSLGFPCPDLSSPSHHVDQDPKGKAEYSFSTNVLDELPQSVAGESKERTDMYCLESLDGDVKSSSASEGMKGKFGPKPWPKIVKHIPLSSSNGTKTLDQPCVPETKSQERFSFSTLIISTIKRCNFKVPDF